MPIRSHKELFVWQKSYALAKAIYQFTGRFPTFERYGLVSQMRRAAISIPSNIAEGYHRGSRNEYRQFCFIAYGSASELETQIELSKDFGYFTGDDEKSVSQLMQETLRLLNKLCHAL